jgi:poly-beta-1,6-N-acetyl-D-glucosamine synthase
VTAKPKANAAMLKLPTYALITPAHNEADFIERTIRSLVAQTVRPCRWIVVSDGSTDGTDDIVKKYAAQQRWIELIRRPQSVERHFAKKAAAFNAGYERLKLVQCEVIGNLDADVSFDDEHFFEFLMGRFAENSRLGVAGTAYLEGEVLYPYRFTSLEDVAGACQLFRRECFESIGGYPPLRSGGIDVVAVFCAQARGWQTRTFTEKTFVHHRVVGTAQRVGAWRRILRNGIKDYVLGSHPTWEFLRSCYQMKNKPYVVGGVLVFAGYMWAMLRRVEKSIPKELMSVRRKGQLERLKDILCRMLLVPQAFQHQNRCRKQSERLWN